MTSFVLKEIGTFFKLRASLRTTVVCWLSCLLTYMHSFVANFIERLCVEVIALRLDYVVPILSTLKAGNVSKVGRYASRIMAKRYVTFSPNLKPQTIFLRQTLPEFRYCMSKMSQRNASPDLLIVSSSYWLSRSGDISFNLRNQSVSPYSVRNVVSCPMQRFLIRSIK